MAKPTVEAEARYCVLYFPLGLPAGSVRALLALLIVGSIWGLMLVAPDRAVPDHLRALMYIILGHYFAALSGETRENLAGPGPLFLPRGSVRFLLFAGFLVVAAGLARTGHLEPREENHGALALLLVGGFLLGVAIAKFSRWRELRRRGVRGFRIFEDLKALLTLGAAIALIVLAWNSVYDFMPHRREVPLGRAHWSFGEYNLEHMLAAVVGFYYGSRS